MWDWGFPVGKRPSEEIPGPFCFSGETSKIPSLLLFKKFGKELLFHDLVRPVRLIRPQNGKTNRPRQKVGKLKPQVIGLLVHEHDIERIPSPFHLGCVAIRKNDLKETKNPGNPYHLALEAGLDQVDSFLSNEGVLGQTTHLLFEKRGKKEDGELKSEFWRLCEKNREEGRGYPFDVVFVDKKANHLGLQLADLLARPIGLSILRPDQANRTYEIMEKKFLPRLLEKKDGRDLRCFP